MRTMEFGDGNDPFDKTCGLLSFLVVIALLIFLGWFLGGRPSLDLQWLYNLCGRLLGL